MSWQKLPENICNCCSILMKNASSNKNLSPSVSYPCYSFFKLFICGFFAKVTCAFLACKKKLSGQKQFSSEENDDIFQIFDQLIVSRWIVYSHWEVTWNYAYSPFNWGRSNLRREEGGWGKNASPAPGYLFASMFKHVQ